MESPVSEPVRLSTELREALSKLHGASRKGWESDQYYRLDRHDAREYFDGLPKAGRKVYEYLRSLRDEGECITYVDVCGRAKATSLGADENYSFSLQPLSRYDPPCKAIGASGEDPRVRGDIFSARDFNRFLDLIRRDGSRPALVTFEPVAGLQSYKPYPGAVGHPRLSKEVTFQILERHLRRMLKLVRPGGYILLGPPFQGQDTGDFFARKPQSEYESSLHVKALCKRLKCSVDTETTLNGPRWLIRKRGGQKKN